MTKRLPLVAMMWLLASACSPATPPCPTGNAPPEDPPATQQGFAPVDLSCSQDADCDTFHRVLTEDDRCCYTCEHTVAAKAWITQAMALCESKSEAGCEMAKCVGPPPVRCADGRCTF